MTPATLSAALASAEAARPDSPITRNLRRLLAATTEGTK